MGFHGRAPAAADQGPPPAPNEADTMLRRRLHSALAWAPILAVLAQLVLATAVAAATGGGDFPRL